MKRHFFLSTEYHELLLEAAVVSNKLASAVESGLCELTGPSYLVILFSQFLILLPLGADHRTSTEGRSDTLGEALAEPSRQTALLPALMSANSSEMMGE